MSDIESLKAAVDAAYKARLSVQDAIRAERRIADEKHSEIIAQIEGAHRPALVDALKAEKAAQAAYDAAVAEAALAANADMYRGLMVEWGPKSRYSFRNDPWVPTGKKARWEIRTPDSVFPANRSVGLPRMGERFLRPMKKDGSPSLGFVDAWNAKHYWLPEGERHPHAAPLTAAG